MNSNANDKFWKAFNSLPVEVQKQAELTYREWQDNPYKPSLHFKQLFPNKPIYSVRIGIGWRALGKKKDDTIVWFWIGSHEQYNNLVSQVRKRT